MTTLGRALAVACATACLTMVVPVSAQPINPSDSDVAGSATAVTDAEASMSSLVTSISQSDTDIANLELQIGALREMVNKALVDFHDAQTAAEQARQGVTEARKRLDETQAAINDAQAALDEISRATYRRGSTTVVRDVAGTENDHDSLDRKTYLRTNATKQKEIIDELDELRTKQANEESLLREARNIAEERETAADKARQDVQTAIDSSSAELTRQQTNHANLLSQRDQEQTRLDNARNAANAAEGQRNEFDNTHTTEQQHQQEQPAVDGTTQEQAEADSDPQGTTAGSNEAEQLAETDAATENPAVEETNADTSQSSSAEVASVAEEAAAALIAAASPVHDSFSSSESDTDTESEAQNLPAIQNPETDTAALNATDTVDDLFVQLDSLDSVTEQATTAFGNADRATKIETVISRATAQVGVPYAWGGGNANGPTQGIRDGGVADSYGDFNKVGFDCSGLVLYAFAGVGIALPHYTGYQYQRGTKINPQEMQRGDLIFYGPNAENHVAIYLGDGKMIEAPNSGSTVQISDVRWSGMSPYAVRLL